MAGAGARSLTAIMFCFVVVDDSQDAVLEVEKIIIILPTLFSSLAAHGRWQCRCRWLERSKSTVRGLQRQSSSSYSTTPQDIDIAGSISCTSLTPIKWWSSMTALAQPVVCSRTTDGNITVNSCYLDVGLDRIASAVLPLRLWQRETEYS